MMPISKILEKQNQEYSDFQVHQFLLSNNGPTSYAAYVQARRELGGRVDDLKVMKIKIELAELDCEDMEAIPTPIKATDRRRLEIQKQQAGLGLAAMKRSLIAKQADVDRFHGIASDLREQLGELDAEGWSNLDHEMWVSKAKLLLAIDLISQGRMSKRTAEFISQFPSNDRKMLCELFAEKKQLVHMFETSELPLLPCKAIGEHKDAQNE